MVENNSFGVITYIHINITAYRLNELTDKMTHAPKVFLCMVVIVDLPKLRGVSLRLCMAKLLTTLLTFRLSSQTQLFLIL